MSSPLTENLGQPLLHLAQISTDGFPSLQMGNRRPPEPILDRLLPSHLASDEPRLRLQSLIQHSMDAELFASSRRHDTSDKLQTALIRGAQKQASAYVVTQEQRNLISASTQTFGYA